MVIGSRGPRGILKLRFSGEGGERFDLHRCDIWNGRVVRLFPRKQGQVPYPERGDGVESQALSQIIGFVEPAVLDPGAGLQSVEKSFDPPAKFVPAQRRACGFEAGFAFGGQQHPVKRLSISRRGSRRVLLDGRNRQHADCRAALFGRGNQIHLLASDCQPRPARLAPVRAAAARNLDDPASRRLGLGDMEPEVLGGPVGQPAPSTHIYYWTCSDFSSSFPEWRRKT